MGLLHTGSSAYSVREVLYNKDIYIYIYAKGGEGQRGGVMSFSRELKDGVLVQGVGLACSTVV